MKQFINIPNKEIKLLIKGFDDYVVADKKVFNIKTGEYVCWICQARFKNMKVSGSPFEKDLKKYCNSSKAVKGSSK